MFAGIIETMGVVTHIEEDKNNVHYTIKSTLTPHLKIDQSIAHNGVCLTVVNITDDSYTVTAINETLQKTNLKSWVVGSTVNLERCLVMNGRIDGHIVQGHVDATIKCVSLVEDAGSWLYTFELTNEQLPLIVSKGSVCINGVSLTVVNPVNNNFSVAIIPYTYEHTTFNTLKANDYINIEFDIIGKYFLRYQETLLQRA
jgi:riboflavin synthase